jgi:hypothetical protein
LGELLSSTRIGRLLGCGLGFLAMAVEGVEPHEAEREHPDEADNAESGPHRHLLLASAGDGRLTLLDR